MGKVDIFGNWTPDDNDRMIEEARINSLPDEEYEKLKREGKLPSQRGKWTHRGWRDDCKVGGNGYGNDGWQGVTNAYEKAGSYVDSESYGGVKEKRKGFHYMGMQVRWGESWFEGLEGRELRPPLWDEFWYEGEVCCLFSDTNVGKSILGVQIGEAISRDKGKRTVYFDFEMNIKQFKDRYTDRKTLYAHRFPWDFVYVEVDSGIYCGNIDSLLSDIESIAFQTKGEVLIIDNLMCMTNGDIVSVNKLMHKLKWFVRTRGWSILLLAHTPKRNMTKELTQNDLAGSKRLINYCDSAFCIGKSAKDESLRYLKQIKSRQEEMRYGGERVKVYEIVRKEEMISFEEVGESEEKEHLLGLTEQKEMDLRQRVCDWHIAGKSIREISRKTGLSKSKVGRIVLDSGV